MVRYRLLAFLCLATLVAYLQRSALGVPSKQIESELGLTPADMGLVWLAWYAAYALFQIPAGLVADRLGSKLALVIFAVLWSAFTACTGLANGFASLCTLWGAMGLCQAAIFVCATKAIGVTFSPGEQATASGALACAMAAGAALAQQITGQLLGAFSWQQILIGYGVPGVVWAVLFAVAVPPPEASVALKPLSKPRELRWTRLITSGQLWLLSTQQFLRAGAIALFFTWFPRYLQETKGVTVATSGSLAMWPLLAGMLGGLAGGGVSDWLLSTTGNGRMSRQIFAAVGTAICAVVSLVAFWVESANVAVGLISIAAFCGYVSGVSAYAIAIEMGGTHVAPVFATMNMAGNLGAGVFPFLVGRLVGTTGNWHATLLLFAGMFAASTLCWLLLNPLGPLDQEVSACPPLS
jgi:MFS family permease